MIYAQMWRNEELIRTAGPYDSIAQGIIDLSDALDWNGVPDYELIWVDSEGNEVHSIICCLG